MALDKLKEKALGAAGGFKNKIADMKDNIFGSEEKEIKEEFKESGTSKIQEMLNYITGSSDLIRRAGFELSGLGVSIAIAPLIKVSFAYLEKIAEEERAGIIEEVKDKRIIKILLSCLFKASDFVDGIKVGNYKLGGVEISLGLTPGINVTFKK